MNGARVTEAFKKDYMRERAPHFQKFAAASSRVFQTPAHIAFHNLTVRREWRANEWDEHSTPEIGEVRLRVVPDDCADIDDLLGDTYNPKVNPEIPLARLERERDAEIERINREGVCGVIGEYFDGESWQHADSCFGFVGDDWKESGYDVDIMAQTLDAASKIETCPTCHRPLRKAN